MIPKRLFYIWFGDKPLPQTSRQYLQKWQELNPDFELVRISEKEFDPNYCQFTRQAYQAGKLAFVSDVARLWVINHYGGFYVDTDVEPLKPIGNLCHFQQVWAKEDVGAVASGLLFGASAGDQVLSEILQSYQSASFDSQHLTEITTVKMCSRILKRYGLQNNRRVNWLTNGGVVLSPQYCAPFHYWGGGRVTAQTISIHHYTSHPNWTNSSRSNLNYLMHQTMFYFPLWGDFVKWFKNKITSK